MLSEELKALRTSRGLSQNDVSRLIGRTRQCVYYWESGSAVPSPASLARFLDAVGASADERTRLLDLRFRTVVDREERPPTLADLLRWAPDFASNADFAVSEVKVRGSELLLPSYHAKALSAEPMRWVAWPLGGQLEAADELCPEVVLNRTAIQVLLGRLRVPEGAAGLVLCDDPADWIDMIGRGVPAACLYPGGVWPAALIRRVPASAYLATRIADHPDYLHGRDVRVITPRAAA